MTSAGNRRSKIATIVGSDKGGVGKSLMASLLIEAYDQARRPLGVVEIDHQGKLRSVMGSRVDLSLGASADLGEIVKDRKHAERFYNPVFERWRQSDSLTDLGANVTTQVFNWIQQCHVGELAAEDGIRFRFVAVTTPDDQALRSAYSALTQAARHLAPKSNRQAFDSPGSGIRDDLSFLAPEFFLVLNEFSPGRGFDHYENHPIFGDLKALRPELDLKMIYIPNCDSELMEYGRSRALSPLAVFQTRERLVQEMNLGRVEARTEQKRLLDWIVVVQDALRPLFAEPAPRRPVASSPPAVETPPVRTEPARVHEFPLQEASEHRLREDPPLRSFTESGAVVENLLDRRELEASDTRGARRVHAADHFMR